MRRTHLTLYRDEFGHDVQCSVLSVGSGAPHVVLTALQHGNEPLSLDAGLGALQYLSEHIVHGTVTLLTCLNPIGFHEGTRNFLNRSFDLAGSTQTNLNRLHPGNPDGTLAERAAYAIDQYLIRLAPNYLIDLHTYAVQSVPHVVLDPVQGTMLERLTSWATNSGLPFYHEFAEENYASQGLTNCLSGIWCDRNVPAITLELGPQVGFGVDDRMAATSALLHTLQAIDVAENAPELAPATDQMAQTLAGNVWQRLEIENSLSVQGYVRQRVSIGTVVTAGQSIADIVQLDGRIAGQILAPEDGVVFIWHDEPRAYPGSKLGIILRTHES